MSIINFNSRFEVVRKLYEPTQEEIKNEPMFFSAHSSYVNKHGGKISQLFIDRVYQAWGTHDFIIDSRVHMLMKGWYPCIPGWHLDDVPRTRADGQPDHANPIYKSEHMMAFYGDAAPTKFLLADDFILADIPEGRGVVYQRWHNDIEYFLNFKVPGFTEVDAEPSTLISFNWQSFHRGTAAVKDGWRLFIRATKLSTTNRVVKNEIRKQVQVYMSALDAGW